MKIQVPLWEMLGRVKYKNSMSWGSFSLSVFVADFLFHSLLLNFSKFFCSHLYSFVFILKYIVDILKFFPSLPLESVETNLGLEEFRKRCIIWRNKRCLLIRTFRPSCSYHFSEMYTGYCDI